MQVPCYFYFGLDRCFLVCESYILKKRIVTVLANLSSAVSERNVLLVGPLRLGPRHELEACARTQLS